jgi:putative flippase GtrA
LIRYTMVSVISTIVSFGVLALVFGVLHLWGEIASTVFANVVATVPSYFLNRQWVWGKSGRSRFWREILPFFVVSFTGIGFALVTAALARSFAQTHHLHHLTRTALVVGANIGAFAVVWLLKFVILNKLFGQLADRELGTTADNPVAAVPDLAGE